MARYVDDYVRDRVKQSGFVSKNGDSGSKALRLARSSKDVDAYMGVRNEYLQTRNILVLTTGLEETVDFESKVEALDGVDIVDITDKGVGNFVSLTYLINGSFLYPAVKKNVVDKGLLNKNRALKGHSVDKGTDNEYYTFNLLTKDKLVVSINIYNR